MADNKVALAVEDVSVHVGNHKEMVAGNEVYAVSSRVVRRGSSVPLESLPPYLREKVEAGGVAGLRVMDESEAVKLQAALESGTDLAVILSLTSGGGSGFSDHHVSQRERVANHAEVAVADGDADESALPSLEGLDSSGVETRNMEEVAENAAKAKAKAASKASKSSDK